MQFINHVVCIFFLHIERNPELLSCFCNFNFELFIRFFQDFSVSPCLRGEIFN